MNSSLMEELAKELGPLIDRQKALQYAVKHDVSGTPSSLIYSHGPNGLLSFPGVDPVIFNASMGAASLINEIPTMPSVMMNPTYFTLTGVQDVTGANKSAVCDNAPVAGLMKGCLTTSVFGLYELATQELDIGRLGQRVDRADPMDLRLVGTPLGGNRGPFSTGVGTPTDVLTNETSRKMWERNVAFYRLLARQIWSGNPANNAAAGGYKEMTGLSVLVATGYKDAETNVACPAADSYVVDYNYGRIDANGGNIVATITDAYYQVKDRAENMGLAPVRFVMAMKPQMFYELTSVWPCSYMTFRCVTSSGNQAVVDASDMIGMRDAMRAGRYLVIDGDRIEVILDAGIPELNGNTTGSVPRGCFSSDIYILPMSVVGGQSVLYMEYFQYNNPSLMDALGNMVLGRVEGAFITWPRQTNLCVQFQSRIEPRMVLRTPWLAARIQHVAYCPIQHTRQAFPDEPYFADGGKTSRSGPSYYALWQS